MTGRPSQASSASSSSPLSPLFLPLLALLPLIYMNFTPLLNQFAGRVGDAKLHTVHAGHGAVGNDQCWKFVEGQACEDVRIHHETGDAFLACGHPETRAVWYPPIGRVDGTTAKSYTEYFVKHNLDTNTTTRMTVEGYDGDLILHGLDLHPHPTLPSTLSLWAVNHARTGESILKFHHTLGSNTLVFQREYTHALIKTPNAVAAISEDGFFITNDHYFYPGTLVGGVLRKVEGMFGPFSWASGVVYCEGEGGGGKVECRQVSPEGQHPAANGIVAVDGGRTVLVNEIVKGTTTVYDVDAGSKELTVRQEVYLGAAADNISELPDSGDVVVCVFPSPLQLHNRLSPTQPQNLLNNTLKGEAAVLRLKRQPSTSSPGKGRYADPEVLYWDDGSLITVLTGAAVDEKRGKMVAGGLVVGYFVVCDVGGKL